LYQQPPEETRDQRSQPVSATMRPALRLLMASAMPPVNSMKPGPMALLPPIYLYRRILRANRKHLSPEKRLLGDEYVKSEFRAHRDVENPVHLVSRWHGSVIFNESYSN